MKPSTPNSARGTKILIADDCDDVREVLFATFARAGYAVQVAADGETAWQKLNQESCDLLVTDNDMPGLNGVDLVKRLRGAGMNFPVIMVSGSAPVTARPDFAELKLAAVVSKPFNFRELLAVAKIALSEVARQAGTSCEAGAIPVAAGPVLRPARKLSPQNQILIADDDAVVRGSLAAVLQSEGFEVVEASNGLEAVNRAVQYKPDLVLLDLNLPYVDSWTAFGQLNRRQPLQPLIIITARPNQYPQAARLGAAALLEKPLDIPLLVKMVQRLMAGIKPLQVTSFAAENYDCGPIFVEPRLNHET